MAIIRTFPWVRENPEIWDVNVDLNCEPVISLNLPYAHSGRSGGAFYKRVAMIEFRGQKNCKNHGSRLNSNYSYSYSN